MLRSSLHSRLITPPVQRTPNLRLQRIQICAGLGDAHNASGQYIEVKVDSIRHMEKYGHIILLKILDGSANVLPVYIGDFECSALLKEMNHRPSVRPMTHDLMKSTIEVLGYRVQRVRIHALIGSTYYARIHYVRTDGKSVAEVDVDARPSDAINLAVRFSCPIYVNREVAAAMCQPAHVYDQPGATNQMNPSGGNGGGGGSGVAQGDGVQGELIKSCREEMLMFQDPTMMLKLQMQLAIAEERYEDAIKMRNDIEHILSSDRELGMIVALETALDDQRYDEAARLRDELKLLRRAQLNLQQQSNNSATSAVMGSVDGRDKQSAQTPGSSAASGGGGGGGGARPEGPSTA